MKSFTILELLLTMSIISILVALLASSAAKAKEAGQKGACIANARNIKSLNLVGVPVVYPREYPYTSPFEGKSGYIEVRFPYQKRVTILFVNCFDCHNHEVDDPWDPLHELVTVY